MAYFTLSFTCTEKLSEKISPASCNFDFCFSRYTLKKWPKKVVTTKSNNKQTFWHKGGDLEAASA